MGQKGELTGGVQHADAVVPEVGDSDLTAGSHGDHVGVLELTGPRPNAPEAQQVCPTIREVVLIDAVVVRVRDIECGAGDRHAVWSADITRHAEGITSTNLSERLPVIKTGDELERLSISLNHMIAGLENAFQHIARFSADASHELRTPLTILQLELEGIVQHPRLAPEIVDQIGSALEETHRLSRIVENLLIISRLDAGEACIEKLPLDLGELATSTADQMRLLAEEKSVSLRCDVSQDVWIEGDQARLKQVIVNLTDNAIKYTPAGGQVTVAVRASEAGALLEVADTGVGISAEALPHVFERFYRTDKARSRDSGGAGLGLAIVKSICSAHNAEIRVLSLEGQGSRFIVQIANGAVGENEVMRPRMLVATTSEKQ